MTRPSPREQLGSSPLQWILHAKVRRAQQVLETTDLPIERVSEFSGLGTAANLRRHFTLQVGVSPTDYRQSFGTTPARRRHHATSGS